MAGFPQRPSRNAFGARKVDAFEVRDPKRQLGQAPLNLMFDVIAGAALPIPFAVAVVDPALNGGGGGFEHLAIMSGVENYGLSVAQTDPLEWTISYEQGGYTDENGTVVTYAEAVNDPTLSPYVQQVLTASVQFLIDAVDVAATIAAQVSGTDIVVTQTGVAAALPFSLLLWSRNGGPA